MAICHKLGAVVGGYTPPGPHHSLLHSHRQDQLLNASFTDGELDTHFSIFVAAWDSQRLVRCQTSDVHLLATHLTSIHWLTSHRICTAETHLGIVQRVNHAIGGKFPEQCLCACPLVSWPFGIALRPHLWCRARPGNPTLGIARLQQLSL